MAGLEAASQVPRLRGLVGSYEVRHPACLNAILTNAPAEVWHAFHCGQPAG